MMPQVFRGRTLEDARRAAAVALGAEPVVITTRKVRRAGLAGLVGGCDVEIAATRAAAAAIAAPRILEAPTRSALGPFAAGVYEASDKRGGSTAPTGDVARLRAELRAEIRSIKAAVTDKPAAAPQPLLDELAAMRALLDEMAPAPKRGDKVATWMKARGIEGPAATALTRAVKQTAADGTVEDRVREALAAQVRVAAWPLAADGRAVIALVGPTGVGKTTTIAKLAARARIEGRSIALVGCDAFRVGAIDQLRRYATLLDARFEVARDSNELARVLDAVQADLIFVDTAGRVPDESSPEAILAPGAFIASSGLPRARHVLLCVPAALRANDAARLARTYQGLGPTSLAVTKLDETDAPSGLLHAPAASKLPLSTLCFGQRVPEDVSPATGGAVLEHLAPRKEARALTTTR